MKSFDVIILGGGAAGLMCAAVAGRRGRSVVVLEGSNKVGKKILMSGGGRCNFTNLNTTPDNFLSANPHFCKSALSRYAPLDFVELVESHRIPYHEKTAGQLFCDHSSKDILGMLMAECSDAGVEIHTSSDVGTVTGGPPYTVTSAHGRYASAALVIATGGLSIPKMGASGFGYRLAQQFGLNVMPTRAGLVPFTFSGAVNDMTGRLSGVSCKATLSTTDSQFTDDILFTHRGLSGPAALQLSSYWNESSDIAVNLDPYGKLAPLLPAIKAARPKVTLRTVISEWLPRALALELQGLLWPAEDKRPLAEFSDERLRNIGAELQHWNLRPSGTEGYRTAEVTLGGVDTAELSSQTMECKRQPGLYCIGEVVDVTGHLGGYNFQWAWASAQAAGNAL